MLNRQFIYFLFTGGIAAGLNWGSRFLFSEVFSFETAVVLAFIIGLLSGFILMRVFVFDGKNKPVIPQIGKYIAVNLFALLQTLAISLLFVRWILPAGGVVDAAKAEAIGHLVGVLVPVVTSYFGHKLLTFR